MGCFFVQKNRRKVAEQQVKPDIESFEEMENVTKASRLVASSFRQKARALQHAQRFINISLKRRFLHPEGDGFGVASPMPPRTHSTADHADYNTVTFSLPLDKASIESRPMPLPSPSPFPNHSRYRLPRPQEYAAISAPIESPSPRKSPLISSLSVNSGIPLKMVHKSDPLPLPPPPEGVPGLRPFSFEELTNACCNFSPGNCVEDGLTFCAYSGVIRKAEKQEQVIVAGVLCKKWQQGYTEWLAELSVITRLQGPFLCKLIGYYEGEESLYRFMVYERLPMGGLDKLLYGETDSPPLSWPSRVKIALSAAEGLAYLHEKASEKIMYRDFRTSNIDVNNDFSSKLSLYGFARYTRSAAEKAVIEAYCAPESRKQGYTSAKCHVWGFGIVLLELLTGKQNMDLHASMAERNLTDWARPFLMDAGRLFLVMDPKLQGDFPSKGAKLIADLVLQCLEKDPNKRPTMKHAVAVLGAVQEVRYRSRFTTKGNSKEFKLVEAQKLKPLAVP